jgi:signal transduction histidine kinase
MTESSPQRSRKPLSLALRLFILAAVWSLLALAVAYFVLVSYYRSNVERGFETLLDLHLFNVVAAIQQDEVGQIYGEPQLGDPRFESFHSGFYWQVIRLGEPGKRPDQVLVSPSLAGERLGLRRIEEVPFDSNFRRAMDVEGPAGERLRAVEQIIVFDSTGDRLSFTAAADLGTLDADIDDFRNLLLVVFTVLGVGLVAITVLQVRVGLTPLRQVGNALTAVREGRAEALTGTYPREIVPLTTEINALIESNAKIIERARTQVGNLAHALKTPLSVITNEARTEKGAFGEKVIEQAGLMRHQIDYYLDRARVAASAGIVSAVTDVEPVAETFARAMTRIYADRGIDLALEIEPGSRFQGERQDLEELFGNLVDNAFKWAKSNVRLSCRIVTDKDRKMLDIVVEDDGPGLSEEECREAMRRGRRLDETQPGSGLGLSIVRDLADLYDGAFELSRSPLGGLQALLRLPAA